MDKKMYINLDKDDEEDQELLDMLDNKVSISKSTKIFAKKILGEIKEEDEEKLNKEDSSRIHNEPEKKNELETKNKKLKLVIEIPDNDINVINNNIINKDNKFLNANAIKTPTDCCGKFSYMNGINNFKIFRNNNQIKAVTYNPLISSNNNNLTIKSPKIENSKNNFIINNNSKKYNFIPEDVKCPTAIFQTISNSINDVIVPLLNKNKRNCNSRCQNKNSVLVRQFSNNKKEDKYLRQKINTAPNKKIKNLVIEREMFNSANDTISLYGKLHKIKIEKGTSSVKLNGLFNKKNIFKYSNDINKLPNIYQNSNH